MRQTPVDDYLEEISTKLPEELYGRLSDAIYETVCDFDEEVDQLKSENAKLRELVVRADKLMQGVLDCSTDTVVVSHAPCCDTLYDNLYIYREDMREMGIEVQK